MPRFHSHRSYSDFANHVGRERRYFQDKKCKEFLDAVRETSRERAQHLDKGAKFLRAQIGSGMEPIFDDDGNVIAEVPGGPLPHTRMVPDPNKAREGRGNPCGIAYLYLSDKVNTAIAEVRPWVGAEVSIGVFEVTRKLKVIDCRVLGDVRPEVYIGSPPPQERWDEIVWAGIDRAFATPCEPGSAKLTYVPTQMLAELFLSEGYDGVVYRSALSDGHNLMLFDLSAATLVICHIHRVTEVAYSSEQIGNSYARKSQKESQDRDG